jgi:hypothetical protein
MELSLVAAGESYAATPGLSAVARYGHFTSPERPWKAIRFGI